MWEATLKDGSVVSEGNAKWSDIKLNVKRLSFYYYGIKIDLPENKNTYVQGKTASAVVSNGPMGIEIESRWIGFIDNEKSTRIRFFEKEKRVVIENE